MFYYFLFFLFSLGQIGRLSFLNQQINIYLYEILLFGFFIYLFKKYKLKPFLQKNSKWLYFFSLSLFLSFLLTVNQHSVIQNSTAFLYLLRTSFYFVLLICLRYYSLKQKDINEYIRPGLLLFFIFTLITSFIQYFLYPNLRNLSYLGWDPHLFRIFGVFFDTSISSAIFGMIIIYVIREFNNFSFSKMSRWLLLITFSVLGILTYSRGFYISIIITLIYYLIKNKKIKYLLFILLLFITSLVIIPKPFGEGVNLLRTYSIESRLKQNQEGIRLWFKNPVFGIGYNQLKSIRQSQTNTPTHATSAFPSSFITLLATSGVVGLFFFLIALRNIWLYSPYSKYYVLFLSIFSLMDNILLHPFILFLLLFFVYDSKG